MIERHITFNVHFDKHAEFERFFAEEYRPEMEKSPGFVRVDLLREAEQPSRYEMLMRWTDGDAAVGWRISPVHQSLQPGLNALHSGMEIVAYEVVA